MVVTGAIVGTTGGGKSYTVSKLVESLNKQGNNSILMDSTSEYTGSYDRLKNVNFGDGKNIFHYSQLTIDDLFFMLKPSPRIQIPKLMEAIRSFFAFATFLIIKRHNANKPCNYLHDIFFNNQFQTFFCQMKNNKKSRFFYIVGMVTTIASMIGLLVFTALKISVSEPTNFSYNDGPYIFYLNDSSIKTITIRENKLSDFTVLEKTISTRDTFEINNLSKVYSEFNPFEKFESSSIAEYTAEKIGAVSDIHGSFYHFKQLLLANRIIDDSLNWNWGKGHLVIVGDVFDKGPYVSECLWLIKKLEVQSASQGGRVHFLLGNHERLVLSGDNSYVDIKYREICKRLFINYNQLFTNDTYWGQWLRSKSIIIKINNNLFTHGGISEQMLNKKYTPAEINRLFNNWVNTSNPIVFDEKMRNNFSLIINSIGPLEFRGYYNINIFNRGRKQSFPEATIDKINNFYHVNHLIVGHTIVKEVKGLFSKKVIAINNRYPEDDVIDKNSDCEMLIIEGSDYFRAGLNGSKTLLFTDYK